MSSNPWLAGKGVFHWAHQGGAREAPSNTLRALRRAREEAQADGLELDVHRCRSGELVLIHDQELERTTNGHGKVGDHDLAQLKELDAAHWWVPGQVDDHQAPEEDYELRGLAPGDPDLCVATLAEVLDAFPGVPLTIEVKDEAAVEPLVELLEQRQVDMGPMIVTSFKERVVRKLRKRAPHLALAPGRVSMWWFFVRVKLRLPPKLPGYVAVQLPHRYGFENLPPAWRWIGRLLPARFRRLTVLDERMVQAASRCDVAVHAWTIDDEEEMRELVEMGVRGIMTDRPTALTRALQESDDRWAATSGP